MPAELFAYILKHGYLAIFSLVFSQEIGIPNPIPNELVLLFSGYLAFKGTLRFELVFFTAVVADFIGTTLLYTVFYFFGHRIIMRFPNLISSHRLDRLTSQISGGWSVYIGRLLPYVRGYTSVAAGLLNIRPRVFIPAVIFSAITWSGGYVIVGRLLGPDWNKVATKILHGKDFFILGLLILVVAIGGPYLYRWYKKSNGFIIDKDDQKE